MGLTIFYRGNFRKDQSLHEMINEAIEFAKSNNWKFHIFDTEFPDDPTVVDKENKYGILLAPPHCEPVHLYFDAYGRLGFESDLRDVIVEAWIPEAKGESRMKLDILPPDYEPTWGAFTKTQCAGATIHLKVVEILRQLSVKYFSDFSVDDESEFWDHRDEKLLRLRFGEGVDSVRNSL